MSSVGKHQRQFNGKEPRTANGKTPRNTAATMAACCCGNSACSYCTAAPTSWDVQYAGIVKCNALSADPVTSFEDVAFNFEDAVRCAWSQDKPTTFDGQVIHFGTLLTISSGNDAGILLQYNETGITYFDGADQAVGPDCSATVSWNNRCTVCGGSCFTRDGTAVATPIMPP